MKRIGIVFVLLCILVQTASASHVFKDIWQSDELHEATAYLKEKGVISGYSDGTFKPNQEIKRVEVLKILLEGADINVPSVSATETVGFPDLIAGQWYIKYVKRAKALGIVSGYADGTFRPITTVKLSEALKMLFETHSKYADSIRVGDTVSLPSDVKVSDWFASYIKKALVIGIIEKDKYGKVYPSSALHRGKFALLVYQLLLAKEEREASIQKCPCTVVMQNLAFAPNKSTIRKGNKVIFNHLDGVPHQVASDPHPTHTDYTALNGPVMSEVGSSFEVTFDDPGIYKYHCHLHQNMSGTIEVVE